MGVRVLQIIRKKPLLSCTLFTAETESEKIKTDAEKANAEAQAKAKAAEEAKAVADKAIAEAKKSHPKLILFKKAIGKRKKPI